MENDSQGATTVAALLSGAGSDTVDLGQQSAVGVAEHIAWFIDLMAANYTSAVGHVVSLSAKFLVQGDDGDQPTLDTLYRSTNTRDERQAYTPPHMPRDHFSYSENSAFNEIVRNWPDQQSFATDDLFEKWLVGEYHNSNRFWSSFYNSTAVVAIPQSVKNDALPVGFLCADSRFGRLAEADIVSTLAEAACHVYDVLGVLLQHEHKRAQVPAIKGEASLYLPCGWKFQHGKLVAQDRECQAEFETVIASVKSVFSPERLRSGVGSSEHRALSHYEGPMGRSSDDEFVPGYDDLAYENAPARPKRRPRTKAETDAILERMALINPDAAAQLANRKH